MSFGRRQPSGHCGVERRRSVRRPVDASAVLLLPTLERMTGRVVDWSNSGACVEVPLPHALPHTLDLRVCGRTYRTKVAHRGKRQIGVSFL